MSAVHEIHIRGFKSIEDQRLQFGPLNVMVGANGAGKSNLVGVFRLLHRVWRKELQTFTGESGGANALLYFGRKRTEKLGLRVEFREAHLSNIYEFELQPTDEDRFIFASEAIYFHKYTQYPHPYNAEIWSGHVEARVADSPNAVARYVRQHLESYRIYHFHDTSPSAPPKQTCDVSDNRFLRSDASNLAAFLYRLKQTNPDHFANIEATIRQIAPFFAGFRLAPSALNPERIRLEWGEQGTDAYFGPAALSDGTLRFMCLATLLLQPSMPSLILIDEPELGLHPAAVYLLSGLLRYAAKRTQVLVATQSVTLINHLQPEDVWVVERTNGHSQFRQLAKDDMSSWLEDYSLGELWEKNVIGGRP